MKKIATSLLSALLATSFIGSAQADPGRRHGHEYRPHHVERHHHRHHRHHSPPRIIHRHHSDWIGPAAVLALGGLAIGAAIQHERTPAVVYSAPPPPSGAWYYCASSGIYYPYTRACPEGWQAVAPR